MLKFMYIYIDTYVYMQCRKKSAPFKIELKFLISADILFQDVFKIEIEFSQFLDNETEKGLFSSN